jgi:hypothetical protein
VTGGNHSWDGPEVSVVHDDPRVLRPLNVGLDRPGRGARIVEADGWRLGVVNLAGRGVLPDAAPAEPVLDALLAEWEGQVDAVLVDHHAESPFEKHSFAWRFTGRVSAICGTHTHTPTIETNILPGGTAFCVDVGMTGPSGGMMGYTADPILRLVYSDWHGADPLALAPGPVVLGAVAVTMDGGRASGFERISPY